MFKMTLLPRRKGVRVWFNVIEDEESKEVLSFLNEYVASLTGGKKFSVILLSKSQVQILRVQDAQYKSHIQDVEGQLEKDGLKVAANLSSLLMKHKHPQAANQQRKVSKLVDLVGNVNYVVGRRMKSGVRKDSDEDDDEELGVE